MYRLLVKILSIEILKKVSIINFSENLNFYLIKSKNEIFLAILDDDHEMIITLDGELLYNDQILDSNINILLQNDVFENLLNIINITKQDLIIDIYTDHINIKYSDHDNKIVNFNIKTKFKNIDYIHYDVFFSSKYQVLELNTTFEYFCSIMSAHDILSNSKNLSNIIPGIQICFLDNKLKILSTNYLVGIINYFDINIHCTQHYQSKINMNYTLGSNVFLRKILKYFPYDSKIMFYYYNHPVIFFNRKRTFFIRIQSKSCVYDLRLYISDLNLFDETIIDSNLIPNYIEISYARFKKIVHSVKKMFSTKSLEIVDLSIQKTNVLHICAKSQNASMDFEYEFDKIIDFNFCLKMQSNIFFLINSIVEILCINDFELKIYTSDTSLQGKIIILHLMTNIIFI